VRSVNTLILIGVDGFCTFQACKTYMFGIARRSNCSSVLPMAPVSCVFPDVQSRELVFRRPVSWTEVRPAKSYFGGSAHGVTRCDMLNIIGVDATFAVSARSMQKRLPLQPGKHGGTVAPRLIRDWARHGLDGDCMSGKALLVHQRDGYHKPPLA